MSVLLSRPPEKPFTFAVLPLLENGSPGESFLDSQKNLSLMFFTRNKEMIILKSEISLLLTSRTNILSPPKSNRIQFFYFLFRHEK